jgi:hypothetical protein
MMPRPVLLERMAHTYAYEDAVSPSAASELLEAGYVAGPALHGKEGFAVMPFTPVRPDAGPPVLAFRGTQMGEVRAPDPGSHAFPDLLEDLGPEGVGVASYRLNEGLIASQLASLLEHGRVEVCGHSLGGALAQLAAALLPGAVARVTTFQSSGVPARYREMLTAYNNRETAKGQAPVLSDHHVVKGDLVTPGIGEALTPGELHTYTPTEESGEGSSGVARHAAHPVEGRANGRGWTMTTEDSSA